MKNSFKSDTSPPTKEQLIADWDYDILDKEHALKVFAGKTQDEIYIEIVQGHLGNMADLEDLFVLSPQGLSYYIEPYLRYLSCDVKEDVNTNETVHLYFYFFAEYTHLNDCSHFSHEQQKVLLHVLNKYIEELENKSSAGLKEWRNDLKNHLLYLKDFFGRKKAKQK